MALVVETGSGASNSNGYVAIADVDSYAADLNRTDWTGSDAVKTAAIINATFYLDSKFVFIGTRANQAQALAWPRNGARDFYDSVSYSSSTIPLILKRACMELAIKSLTGEVLMDDLAHGGQVKQETVGPISVTYQDRADAATFYMVLGLLKGIIRPADPTYAPSIKQPSYAADQYFTADQYNDTGNGRSPGGS